MKEEFLHYVWKFQKFIKNELKSGSGETIVVINQGVYNTNSGPDFLNSRIKIGEMEWVGNVEIHVRASDWEKHGHSGDSAYENVILHVVYENDKPVKRKDGAIIPSLSLKGLIEGQLITSYEQLVLNDAIIPCEGEFERVNELTRFSMLEGSLISRLYRKAKFVEELWLKNNADWEETIFQVLCQAYGFKLNSEPFLKLARMVTFKRVAKTRNQMLSLEALLFGAAGWLEDIETPDEYISQLIHEYNFLQHKFQLPENMISKSEWKLLRLRPANFPTIRLAQLAAFLAQNESLFSRIIYCKDLEELKKLFSTPQSDYWRKHYLIGKKASKEIPAMGVSSKSILMINTIVSLLFAYGIQKDNEDYKQKALLFLSQLKPEKNNITKKWEGLNWKAKNAFESQGQIELLNNYCKAKKCLDCKIGNEILSNCN